MSTSQTDHDSLGVVEGGGLVRADGSFKHVELLQLRIRAVNDVTTVEHFLLLHHSVRNQRHNTDDTCCDRALAWSDGSCWS